MLISCHSCSSTIEVPGTEPAEDYFDKRHNPQRDEVYSCPKCHGPLRFGWDQHEHVQGSVYLTAEQAHHACLHLGMPGEQECSAARVREIFTEQSVISLDVVDIPGTSRSELRSIFFSGNVRLYLAAGGGGVTVYRISRPRAYEEASIVVQETP